MLRSRRSSEALLAVRQSGAVIEIVDLASGLAQLHHQDRARGAPRGAFCEFTRLASSRSISRRRPARTTSLAEAYTLDVARQRPRQSDVAGVFRGHTRYLSTVARGCHPSATPARNADQGPCTLGTNPINDLCGLVCKGFAECPISTVATQDPTVRFDPFRSRLDAAPAEQHKPLPRSGDTIGQSGSSAFIAPSGAPS